MEGLIASIQKSDKFDIKQLLERVEGHEHKEFRLVAPLLYKVNLKSSLPGHDLY